MKVYVLYLLVVASSGPQYQALESYPTMRECHERAVEFSIAARRNSYNNLLGAKCREEKA